jgi:mRNA interferase HigB
LREFWETEKPSEIPLDTWYRIALRADWRNFAEVKTDFPSADLVGKYIIFNVGGNKYRLAVKIEFLKQTIYIKNVLTHKQYDKISFK